MRLRRKVDDYLVKWKNSDNKMPLIIKGARQIGKTESIRNFALNNYKSFIEIKTLSRVVCKFFNFFCNFFNFQRTMTNILSEC